MVVMVVILILIATIETETTTMDTDTDTADTMGVSTSSSTRCRAATMATGKTLSWATAQSSSGLTSGKCSPATRAIRRMSILIILHELDQRLCTWIPNSSQMNLFQDHQNE